jgi:hypothetical protein
MRFQIWVETFISDNAFWNLTRVRGEPYFPCYQDDLIIFSFALGRPGCKSG